MPKVDEEVDISGAPKADSIKAGLCTDPTCDAVHIMLIDADDGLIATAALTPETVAAIASMRRRERS